MKRIYLNFYCIEELCIFPIMETPCVGFALYVILILQVIYVNIRQYNECQLKKRNNLISNHFHLLNLLRIAVVDTSTP